MAEDSLKIRITDTILGGEATFTAFFEGEKAGFVNCEYDEKSKVLTLKHTVTLPPFRGKGIARAMIDYAVGFARKNGMKIIPVCSYAQAVFEKEPSYSDVLLKKA
jgi:predicted GNAT family acetyltransferase